MTPNGQWITNNQRLPLKLFGHSNDTHYNDNQDKQDDNNTSKEDIIIL